MDSFWVGSNKYHPSVRIHTHKHSHTQIIYIWVSFIKGGINYRKFICWKQTHYMRVKQAPTLTLRALSSHTLFRLWFRATAHETAWSNSPSEWWCLCLATCTPATPVPAPGAPFHVVCRVVYDQLFHYFMSFLKNVNHLWFISLTTFIAPPFLFIYNPHNTQMLHIEDDDICECAPSTQRDGKDDSRALACVFYSQQHDY